MAARAGGGAHPPFDRAARSSGRPGAVAAPAGDLGGAEALELTIPGRPIQRAGRIRQQEAFMHFRKILSGSIFATAMLLPGLAAAECSVEIGSVLSLTG